MRPEDVRDLLVLRRPRAHADAAERLDLEGLGLRDENSTGDRKELAVARLRKAVQGCASQAPTASQAEALLSVLGEAYIAGVDLDNQWMRAAAARVAEAEQR